MIQRINVKMRERERKSRLRKKDWKMMSVEWCVLIANKIYMCVCVCACSLVGGGADVWADAVDLSVNSRVPHVGDVWGGDVMRSHERRGSESEGCEKLLGPPLPSSTQPPVTAVSSPWQRVPPIWCNAYLYSLSSTFRVEGLILTHDSPGWLYDNYTFRTI